MTCPEESAQLKELRDTRSIACCFKKLAPAIGSTTRCCDRLVFESRFQNISHRESSFLNSLTHTTPPLPKWENPLQGTWGMRAWAVFFPSPCSPFLNISSDWISERKRRRLHSLGQADRQGSTTASSWLSQALDNRLVSISRAKRSLAIIRDQLVIAVGWLSDRYRSYARS